MNLSEIKKKYQDILEESDASSSSQEFSSTMDSVFQGFQAKHKRTQSVANKENNVRDKHAHTNLHTQVIHLKERLCQANLKLERKDTELKSECERKTEMGQEKQLLQRHLNSFQEQIEKRDKQLLELQANRLSSENRLKELEEQCLDRNLDREMLKKQVSYYELEQKRFKEIIREKDQQIQGLLVKNKGACLVKSENERLKNDIERLIVLLEDKKVFKPTNKFNVSYMGKNDRSESENWHSRDLITLAERFLRKNSLPQKTVLPALVKFLSGIQSISTKPKRSVDAKKHRNSSVTYKDISVSLPGNSISSKQHFSDKYSSVFISKDNTYQSTFNHTIEDEEKTASCREIVRQYKNSVDELLVSKSFSRSKLRRLTEWLVDAVAAMVEAAKSKV